MSRKVCDTWFYAIVIASMASSLYYYYPDIQTRYPQETQALEAYYNSVAAKLDNSLRQYVPFFSPKKLPKGMFDTDTLALYDGKSGSKGLYLALLGKVYNVEKGAQYYREGGAYAFFAGKDATRAYITGDFSPAGLTDDLSELSEDMVAGIATWIELYQKEYSYMGKLVGRYYTETGEATPELRKIEKILANAETIKDKEEEVKKRFPPCNSEYSAKTGHRVWCSKQSGGISRSWEGVPRRFHPAGMSQERCVCVRTTGAPSDNPSGTANNGDLSNPNLLEYADCEPDATSCKLK